MTGAGFPHSDIHGSKLGRQLPVAFRSHHVLSSVVDAKASTVALCSLEEQKMLVFAMQFSRSVRRRGAGHELKPRRDSSAPRERNNGRLGDQPESFLYRA